MINFFLGQSAELNKTLQHRPPPTPSAEAHRGGLIRHHHATVVVANGTTMVVVFVGCLTLVREAVNPYYSYVNKTTIK